MQRSLSSSDLLANRFLQKKHISVLSFKLFMKSVHIPQSHMQPIVPFSTSYTKKELSEIQIIFLHDTCKGVIYYK